VTAAAASGVLGVGDVVHVESGTYSYLIGESFPISIPEGVTITGASASSGLPRFNAAGLFRCFSVVHSGGFANTFDSIVIETPRSAGVVGFRVTAAASSVPDPTINLLNVRYEGIPGATDGMLLKVVHEQNMEVNVQNCEVTHGALYEMRSAAGWLTGTIENNTVTHSPAFGLLHTSFDTSQVEVFSGSNTITDSGSDGIRLMVHSPVAFGGFPKRFEFTSSGNTIIRPARCGIAMEMNTDGQGHTEAYFRVDSTLVDGAGLSGLCIAPQATMANGSSFMHIPWEGNTITNCGDAGLAWDGSGLVGKLFSGVLYGDITNNNVHSNLGPGMRYSMPDTGQSFHSEHLTTGNLFQNNHGDGVLIENLQEDTTFGLARDLIFRGNTMTNNLGSGIAIRYNLTGALGTIPVVDMGAPHFLGLNHIYGNNSGGPAGPGGAPSILIANDSAVLSHSINLAAFGNDWGTPCHESIEEQTWHQIDDSHLAHVDWEANQPPIAQNDAASTDWNVAVVVPVLINDHDPDGCSLLIGSLTSPANGVAVITGSMVTYTPAPGFFGTDTFDYLVIDGSGGSDWATVVVDVHRPNNPPVAVDDSDTTLENTTVTIPVLSNDTDPDGDPLSVHDFDALSAQGGTVVQVLNSLEYTPAVGFDGIDTFTYRCSDGFDISNTATVTVDVQNVNNPPVAVDDVALTDEDVPIVIDVLANDTDPDGEPLSLSLFPGVTSQGGTLIQVADTLEYTPPLGWHGVDSFEYSCTDGIDVSNLATVTITVNSTNSPPIAVDDHVTTGMGVTIAVDALANDSDPDGDPLTLTFVGIPTNGVASIVGNLISYSPHPGFLGGDSFFYEIADGEGGTAVAHVFVSVGCGAPGPVGDNPRPTAIYDHALTPVGRAITICVIANDEDSDGDIDPSTVRITQWPNHGSIANHMNGSVTYTPEPGWVGTDTFNYIVKDATLQDSNMATVEIAMGNGGHSNPPAALGDDSATDAVTPVTIDVLANDLDRSGLGLDVASVQVDGNPSQGSTTVHADGSITFTPYPGLHVHAGRTDTFTYSVADLYGTRSNIATVEITISPVNAPPDGGSDLRFHTPLLRSGQVATLVVSGATPGATVGFAWALDLLQNDLAQPHPLGGAVANAQGVAQLIVAVPAGTAQRGIWLQAQEQGTDVRTFPTRSIVQ